jgi:hypothetical protein
MPMWPVSTWWGPQCGCGRRREAVLAVQAVLVIVVSGCSGPGQGSAAPAAGGFTQTPTLPTTLVPSESTSPSVPASGSSQATKSAVATGLTTSSAAPPVPESPTSTAVSTASPAGPAAPGTAGCPGVRCLSIAVTGDVLLHPPLVDQARADSPGGQGMDFGPMLAAEKPYIQGADLGICHLETPLAPADGPFAGYPEFSVPPQVLPALVATG